MKPDNPFPALNKPQRVANLLIERILNEGLQAGALFGTEADLLGQYQVSRPTLRESLRILESQGILSLRPGPKGGIIVAKPSIDVLSRTLSVFLQLHGVPLDEVLNARMAIEPALVSGAALHGTEDQFAAMDAAIDRMAAPSADDATAWQANREFHDIITRAAANPILEVFWRTIRTLSGNDAGRSFSKRYRSYIIDIHRRVLAACRAHDPSTAQELWADKMQERTRARAIDGQGPRKPVAKPNQRVEEERLP